MKRKAIFLCLLVCVLLAACGKTEAAEQQAEVTIEQTEATAAPAEFTEERSEVTEEQAIAAIKNYCYANNASLKDIEEAGQYPVYWDASTTDENEIVVLFRSYTGALIRYYIDPATGDAYVTEVVPGISVEEERTDEQLNVWDYLDKDE